MSLAALIPEIVGGLITASQAVAAGEDFFRRGRSALGYKTKEEKQMEVNDVLDQIFESTEDIKYEILRNRKRVIPTVDEVNGPNNLQGYYPRIDGDETRKLDDMTLGRVMGSGREFTSGYVAPEPEIGVKIYKDVIPPSYKVTSMGNPALGTNGFTKRGENMIPASGFGFHDFSKHITK